MSDYLLIRADASARIGTGHVMRCLALAQAWRRSGGSVIFATAEITAALETRLTGEGFQNVRLSVTPGTNEDATKTGEMARSQNASWVVADGYHFGLDYQQVIKAAGLRLLLLDDYGHAKEYVADLVLNQNISADAALYARRAPYTRLLLGTRYALLREEFLRWRDWKRGIPAVARKVLVTLGGSDPDNVTGKVIQALKQFSEIETKVVVGGSNPHIQSLQSSIIHHPSSIQLVVDATNMPELMAWADFAVAAGGTTSWELAFMGVPSLIIVLALNQRAVADGLAAAQVVRETNLDSLAADLRALLFDFATRKAMSEGARQLVDALGESRVVSYLRASKLNLRPVRAEDCRQIWEWANDPKARSVSLAEEEIPWADHAKWFSARVNSPACFFYVAVNSSENPIGQIRFDVNGDEAILSVSLAKKARGHGYGSALIVQGSQRCFADSRVNLIRAYVKPTNENSIRAFEKADFVPTGSVELRGQPMRQFVLKRGNTS
jgi:UDP-2,4-diacetamido-2,4,6-trideoxy-beta-L-altropyranose hydrolase